MKTVSVAITTHERKKKLEHMVWMIKNQTIEPLEIKIFASGYEKGELDYLGDVSYESDKKDWGHDKRAKAMQWFSGDYLWCVCDDDQYPYTFLERMMPGLETGSDIVYCDFATKTIPGYWIKSELIRGWIGNGCFLTSKRMGRTVPYRDRTYGGDWSFLEACLKAGATTYHVPEYLYFHF